MGPERKKKIEEQKFQIQLGHCTIKPPNQFFHLHAGDLDEVFSISSNDSTLCITQL